MKRTISVMLGKGSVSHNTRQFKAANVDAERTRLNITYCNTSIKGVYSELFDDAVRQYNSKQTRSDRCISDYYEKIRTSKQEKLFKEVIFQIGKLEDMSAKSENGQLAAKVLDEFIQSFQERNPNLRVFSAHLHMDEATPHLHVDFVPFTTGSKRGLDTRVSLKQALAAQGFTGGTRFDTEWNQWVNSEKEQLAKVMERHGIEWERLGTHNKHRSVEDFKIEQREKKVAALEVDISEKRELVEWLTEKTAFQKNEIENAQDRLKTLEEKERFIAHNSKQYDDEPEYNLPEPKVLMSAKNYHDKVAAPLVRRLKDVIRSILSQLFEKTRELKSTLDWANNQVQSLSDKIKRLEPEVERLRDVETDFSRVRRRLGGERTDEIISEVKAWEVAEKPPEPEPSSSFKPKINRKREYVR